MTKMFSLESVISDRQASTGATAVSGTIIDTDGYENVLLIGMLETTSTGNQLIALGGTATDAMSEYTGPAGGEASGIAGTLYLDIHRPRKRYIQANMNTTAACNVEVLTILYGPRNKPTSNATTVHGRQLYSPISGTATVSG